MGTVELEVFETAVECTADTCTNASGAAIAPVYVRTWAFLSTQTTRHHPDGRYVHFQVRLEEGRVGHVEMDVPIIEAADPDLTYIEYVGEEKVFTAADVHGWIEIAGDADEEECECGDVSFELVFTDAGDDGEVGTPDDAVRRLSRGRVRVGDAFCVGPARPSVAEGSLNVRVVDRCPPTVAGPAPRPTPDPDPDPGWRTSSSGGDGCSSGSSHSSSGGGCDCSDSGGSGCDSGSSSGGCSCEGDTSSAGSGCSGDTGGASGCSGDAGSTACTTASRCRLGRRTILGGPEQTPILLGLVIAFLLRRRRRR